MLFNFTNHPSALWNGEQLFQANNEFGSISDIKFPDVPPSAGTEVINEMAEHFGKLLTSSVRGSKDSCNAVLAMGEFTLTCQLVYYLLSRGIRVVSVVTERIVAIEGDKKVSVFRFAGFRDYEIPAVQSVQFSNGA